VSLTDARAIALKTALYHDAVTHDYVVQGFRIYKLVNGVVTAVPTVGIPCRAMIKTYQERNKLRVDSTFNLETQAHLIPTPKVTPGTLIAEEAHKLLDQAPVHYTQNRPYPATLAAWKANGGDCSGTAILCYKFAGQPDPNGTGYNGNGWTGSLIVRGTRVTDPRPGDLTFYGPGSAEHVVVELGNGFVFSHGSEGGPFLIDRHYRSDINCTRRYRLELSPSEIIKYRDEAPLWFP